MRCGTGLLAFLLLQACGNGSEDDRSSGSGALPTRVAQAPVEFSRPAWGRHLGATALAPSQGGPEDALRALEGPTPNEVAAVGFLEPPRTAPGEPPDWGTVPGSWGELEDRLWNHYAVATSASAPGLLFAIARTGGPGSIHRLAIDLAEIPSEEAARGVAALEALGILCSRGYSLDEVGTAAVAQALQSPMDEVAAAAAYALGRCAIPSSEFLVGPQREVLVQRLAQLTDRLGDEGQRLAWRAMAGLAGFSEPVPPEILGTSPPPWLVEVEAVRALASTAAGRMVLADRLAAVPLDELREPRTHVVWVALESLRSAVEGTPELLDRLRPLRAALDGGVAADTPERWIRLRCELAVLEAVASASVDPLQHCEHPAISAKTRADHAVESLLLMATPSKGPSRTDQLLERARDPDPVRSIPALRALAEIDDPRVNPVLRAALTGEDLGVLAAASGAVAVRAMDAAKRDLEAVAPLTDIVRRAVDDGAIEARMAAIEALGSLARTARASVEARTPLAPSASHPEAAWLEAAIVPLATDPHWAVRVAAREALLGRPGLLKAFEQQTPLPPRRPPTKPAAESAAGLRIVTETGPIEVALAGALAPLNVANLVELARTGFFDGLGFHRVVPGFVIQGGDPRGDGYGGPGYVVPCEWSNLRYERGTVGMALAGKDTGGSQFFIAQAPQPHLDGRYTVIGHVVKGMDVVDRILPGARIERVEVLHRLPK